MAKRRRERYRPNRGYFHYAFLQFDSCHYIGILFSLSLLIAPVRSTCSSSEQETSFPSEEVEPVLRKGCKWNFTHRWPPNPPGPSLVLGYLMTRTGSLVRERLGLKIPGMMSYAVEYVNSAGILPENYTLQVEVRDTQGDEVLSTKYVTNLVCSNISAFIGPESTCWVEANIAEAQNIPMISYACTDERASNRKTFARTNPSEIHILKATIETLVHFNWKKFSMIYEESGFQSMAKTLVSLANSRNITINHEIAFRNEDEFPNIFVKTKDETRIYVLISHHQSVSKALLAMTLSGLIKVGKKNYFLLFVDIEEFVQENWVKYIFDPMTVHHLNMSNKCLPKDLQNYEEGFMVIANTLPTNTKCIQDKAREYNKKEPFCFNSDVTKVLSRLLTISEQFSEEVHVPFLPASHLYDAVIIYAEAVKQLYDEAVKEGKTPNVQAIGRNGRAIAQKLTNITFQSILGFNVTMGPERASEGSYSIYFFNASDECLDPKYHYRLPCTSHCLVKISDFRNSSLRTNLTLDILDEPVCGYKQDKCREDVIDVRHIMLIILGTSVTLVLFISILQYRHWKYEQEISGLIWRINKEELVRKSHINQSRVSIASVISQDMNYQLFLPFERMADYRGLTCCLKGIDLENKKQDLNRKVMKQMRAMREIKHRNICPFIGAYVDERRLTLVTEYAHRGSLEDILENEDTKLDELFISSLVQDLLRAMLFLHQSFGPHGNLKSPNCIVTGRWVLQVTDYDLHDIRYESYRALGKEYSDESTPEGKKLIKSLLWRGPEFLREDSFMRGNREGDVYSFGIILHEIIARQGPFSTSNGDTVSFRAIVDEVRLGYTVSGALRRPNTIDMVSMPFGADSAVKTAMEDAWNEDPKSRPDFKELSARLKMMKIRGNLVDHMVDLLEGHNKNLEELVSSRTQELRDEKKKSEELLYSMLPRSVAKSLCHNVPIEPQTYDTVTIYFSDIVGFTSLASESKPIQIFNFLDDLYREFDDTICGYDVYKVETIGDAYMVVSGLPQRNQGRHAGEIASMALELLEKVKIFKIKHKPDQVLKLRIGLHTGPVIAGIVGHTMPRYCLFGDTVNMASRMESNGEALRIHISEACKNALETLGGYHMEKRDPISVKGKGIVQTYWLNSADEKAIQRREDISIANDPFEEGMLRRRSPRLSVDSRNIRFNLEFRSPSLPRSVCEPEESCSTGKSEPSFKDRGKVSPHWRRLSNSVRANSLDHSPRGHLLSPNRKSSSQKGSPSPSGGSCSLDHFPSDTQLKIPAVKGLCDHSSPTSSEPNFPVADTPDTTRVNFSRSARFKDEDGNEAELNPMLDASSLGDLDLDDSMSSIKRGSVLSFIHGIFPKGKRERLNSEKSSLNGMQRESHV